METGKLMFWKTTFVQIMSGAQYNCGNALKKDNVDIQMLIPAIVNLTLKFHSLKLRTHQ